MGTRADFYIGRGKDAEWLGSIAWKGYPDGIPDNLLACKNETIYRDFVVAFLNERDDSTLPEQGWPWPWDDSETTDYAYTFDNEVFYTIGFHPSKWWKYASGNEPDKDEKNYDEILKNLDRCIFPDMSSIKNVSFDKNSGLVVIQDDNLH